MTNKPTTNRLLTTEEFNKRVEAWEQKIDDISSGIISARTRGKGILRNSLEGKTLSVEEFEKAINRIGFFFHRYGVFVHYGVGNGYKRINGTVVRGMNLYNSRTKTWRNEAIAGRQLSRGERLQDVRKMKLGYTDVTTINRRPVDFLDSTINDHIKELADLAGEYYGDRALRTVLDTFDKFKIQKISKHG